MFTATRTVLLPIIAGVLVAVACSTQASPPTATPAPTETPVPPSTPTPTRTPVSTATAAPSPTPVEVPEAEPTAELDALFIYIRAVQLLSAGMYEEAIPAYGQVIRRLPDLAIAYHGRGLAYYHEERPQKALEDFNRAILLKPEFADAYRNRSVVHLDRSDTEKALSDLEAALTIYEDEGHLVNIADVRAILRSLRR